MDYQHNYSIHYYKYNKYKTKYLSLKGGQDNYLYGIKIIKTIGKGMHGSVYLVEDTKTNKQYAMKVEPVFKKHIKKSTKSPIWREIEFAKTISSKYPNQFMKIYRYENKKCKYIHKINEKRWKTMGKMRKDYYKKLLASPYCSIKLTSIVDDILHNILYSLTDKKIILDLFIQVINIAYLTNKEGYYHRDLKPKNIGIVYTKDKYIKILNKDIPTHGYILQAIDYGSVFHNKYELDNWEKDAMKYENDLFKSVYEIIFKVMLKNLIDKYPNVNINKKVPISMKDRKVLQPYLINIKVDNSKWVQRNYNTFEELLYKILFFDKFQDHMNIKDKVELFDFIPIDSVIYYVIHLYDIKKVLQHFINLSS
jgi:hypothetical protein